MGTISKKFHFSKYMAQADSLHLVAPPHVHHAVRVDRLVVEVGLPAPPHVLPGVDNPIVPQLVPLPTVRVQCLVEDQSDERVASILGQRRRLLQLHLAHYRLCRGLLGGIAHARIRRFADLGIVVVIGRAGGLIRHVVVAHP